MYFFFFPSWQIHAGTLGGSHKGKLKENNEGLGSVRPSNLFYKRQEIATDLETELAHPIDRKREKPRGFDKEKTQEQNVRTGAGLG